MIIGSLWKSSNRALCKAASLHRSHGHYHLEKSVDTLQAMQDLACKVAEDTVFVDKSRVCCFLLQGPVGAGKSVFARAFIRHVLGDPTCVVPSPSFLLEQVYEKPGSNLVIRHFDFYRLTNDSSSTDWDALGLASAVEKDVCLIEWPQRASGLIARMQQLCQETRFFKVEISILPQDEEGDKDIDVDAETPRVVKISSVQPRNA